MRESASARPMLRAWLLLPLTVTACATSSPAPLPVVSPRPTIPSAPAGIEPKPSGAYWATYCEALADVQQTLKTSPLNSGACAQPGRMEK